MRRQRRCSRLTFLDFIMARVIPDVQVPVPKLYDGDFIDLTSENESQQLTDDDVVLLDDSPRNQDVFDEVDEVTNIEMDNEATLKSIVNAIDKEGIPKEIYLVPVNCASQVSDQYLIINKGSIETVGLQSISNESQNVKTGQPTDTTALVTLKNSRDNVTTKETPVVQNKKSQNVIIHNHVKISPSKEESNYGIRKEDTSKITAGVLIPVMESNVLENILQRMGPKSKPVGGIVRLSTNTTKTANTSLNNVNASAAGNNSRSLKRTSITQNSLQNCQNSKSSQVFETQDVFMVPSRSEVNGQKNVAEESVKNKNGNNLSLETQFPILQTNLQPVQNKVQGDDDDVILVPSQSENDLVEEIVISTKPSSFQPNTIKTLNQTSSELVKSVQMTYSSNKINNLTNSEIKKTKNKQPLTSFILPELNICNGEQLDITSKTILVHTNKDGKKGYVILNNKQNIVNVPALDKQKLVSNILKGSQNKNGPSFKNIRVKEIRKPPVQPSIHPAATEKKITKKDSVSTNLINKQGQKKPEESRKPVPGVHISFLEQSATQQKKPDIFSKCLQNRWARMNVDIKKDRQSDATAHNNIFKGAGTSSVVDQTQSDYYDVYSTDEGDSTALQNENNSKETNEPNISSEDNDVEFVEIAEKDPLDGTVLIEDTTAVKPCVVTPVDIKKILNEAKKPKSRPKDRCDAITLKKKVLYHKGFTKREMASPICQNYLAIAIHTEQERIKELKERIRSYETKTNFVHCQSDPNKFLPETVQCEPDDDVIIVECNDIEDMIYNSTTLPVISKVVSEVNDRVVNMKKAQQTKSKRNNVEEDLQANLAKPEEALRLIKKGLELIQSWTQEKHVPKEKVKKTPSVPIIKKDEPVKEVKRRKRTPAVTEEVKEVDTKKRRIRSVDKKEFVYQPIKKRERKIRNKPVELPSTEIQDTPKVIKKRGRKRNTVDLGDPNDNELFIVKKVDILKDQKSVR